VQGGRALGADYQEDKPGRRAIGSAKSDWLREPDCRHARFSYRVSLRVRYGAFTAYTRWSQGLALKHRPQQPGAIVGNTRRCHHIDEYAKRSLFISHGNIDRDTASIKH
jgi:hypothetical protein